MSDPRKNRPSASVIHQILLCAASFQRQKGLPDKRNSEEKDWAHSGERIHLWLEDSSLVELKPSEQEVADMIVADRERVIRLVFGEHGYTEWRERRLWYPGDLYSGQADFTALNEAMSVGLLIDYKSLRGDHDAAEDNIQLRALGVLAKKNHPQIKTWYVHLSQPLIRRDAPPCKYEEADLITSEAQMIHGIGIADEKYPPAVPGVKQCRYCKAKLLCPEARALLAATSQFEREVDELSGPDLSKLVDMAKTASIIADAAEKEAKERLRKDDMSVPGWGLRSTGSTSRITDMDGLHNAIVGGGLLDSKTFIQKCLSLKKGETEDAIAAFGNMKLAEAKRRFATTSEPFTFSTEKEKSLQRI